MEKSKTTIPVERNGIIYYVDFIADGQSKILGVDVDAFKVSICIYKHHRCLRIDWPLRIGSNTRPMAEILIDEFLNFVNNG